MSTPRPEFGGRALSDPALGKQVDAMLADDRRVGVPATHRCGRCAKPAEYVDRSFSGAALYICYACSEKGWATFVSFGPFNHPMRRVEDQ